MISIHAPREGGDRRICSHRKLRSAHFNPRPPRGGRQIDRPHIWDSALFQSTPPARGATYQRCNFVQRFEFQSTPPARGATCGALFWRMVKSDISIHAPREGGDINDLNFDSDIYDFNPRPPRGGRPMSGASTTGIARFQSTPPARGATKPVSAQSRSDRNFNPRPPRGGRR